MGINQLPPQAYTRETLMQAFDWIKTQPRQVQDLASTTDALVSVYMQARRRAGGTAITHPVSSQSFKQDLKNLAEGLRQFEDDGAHESNVQAQTTSQIPQAPQQHQPQHPTQAAPPPPQVQTQAPHASYSHHAPTYAQQQPMYQMPPQMVAPPRQMSYSQDSAVNHLDSKSLEVVRLVQSRFNLSSENEALRMLISLGFEKVREIFPKS